MQRDERETLQAIPLSKNDFDSFYNTPRLIKEALDKLELAPRKRWGQNYLINGGAREKIVAALELEKGELVWEIGPGLGALTHLLLEQEIGLKLFEIDPGYQRFLKASLLPNFDIPCEIVAGDALKLWQKEWEIQKADKVIGNLPYNIASTFILSMIENNCIPKCMVFTIQKELADRLLAKPGTKNYAALSVLAQRFCTIKQIVVLKPHSFYPVPKVNSSVLAFSPSEQSYENEIHSAFFKILVKSLFQSRRKTIRNNLSFLYRNWIDHPQSKEKMSKEDFISRLNLDEGLLALRAENLSLEQYVELSKDIQRNLGL